MSELLSLYRHMRWVLGLSAEEFEALCSEWIESTR